MLERDSGNIDSAEDKNINLYLTDMNKIDIKKAIKRGIYHELYDRNYLSNAQLNELIKINT